MRRSRGVRGASNRNEHRSLFSSTVPLRATRITWTWSKKVMSQSCAAITSTKRSDVSFQWTSRRRETRQTGKDSTGSSRKGRVKLLATIQPRATSCSLSRTPQGNHKLKAITASNHSCPWMIINSSVNENLSSTQLVKNPNQRTHDACDATENQ